MVLLFLLSDLLTYPSTLLHHCYHLSSGPPARKLELIFYFHPCPPDINFSHRSQSVYETENQVSSHLGSFSLQVGSNLPSSTWHLGPSRPSPAAFSHTAHLTVSHRPHRPPQPSGSLVSSPDSKLPPASENRAQDVLQSCNPVLCSSLNCLPLILQVSAKMPPLSKAFFDYSGQKPSL